MKKLLSISFLGLIVALCSVTASPLPLLSLALQVPQNYVVLKLSDADLSAITTYAAHNQKQLIASLINGLDIASDVMVHPGVKNKIPMPKLKVGDGFRPYSGTEQFKQNNLKYTDRFLEVKTGKRELLIDPEDYTGTYMSQVLSPGAAAGKKDIPFAQFMWDQVIKAVAREVNDEVAYHGFDSSGVAVLNPANAYVVGNRVRFASVTNNSGGVQDYYQCIVNAAAGQTPDTHPNNWRYVTARAVAPGIESYILAGIAATEIAPVATGVITNVQGVAIGAFNRLFRAWSPAYRRNGIIISCSYTDYDLLIDDILNTYSKFTRESLAAAPYLVLPNSNGECFVKRATWLGSSRRLVSGPVFMDGGNPKHMNLIMGTDLLSDMNSIKVITESELWTMKAGLKARIGFNYQDPEAIKVGDQV